MKLEYAAELSGISIETMRLGLQRMARRVGEAAIGTGEAQKALETLGISAKDLVKLPLEKMFLKITGAVNKMGNRYAKLGVLFKIFDSEAVGLINIMDKGEEAIKGMGAELEAMGGALDEFAIGKIEAANDVITKMKKGFKAIGDTIAVRISPMIVVMQNRMSKFGNRGQDVVHAVFDNMETFIDRTIVGLDDMLTKIDIWGGTFIGLITGIGKKINEEIIKPLFKVSKFALFIMNPYPGIGKEIKEKAGEYADISKSAYADAKAKAEERARGREDKITGVRDAVKQFFADVVAETARQNKETADELKARAEQDRSMPPTAPANKQAFEQRILSLTALRGPALTTINSPEQQTANNTAEMKQTLQDIKMQQLNPVLP
jgi:hypothetical protein